MTWALVAFAVIILALLIAFAFWRVGVKNSFEAEARRLADAMAREAKKAAEQKINEASQQDVEAIKNASHDELLRIARDLARRD